MDCLLGICGADFVMMATDCNVFHSIIVMKSDYEKFHQMGDRLLMTVVGEGGDPNQFAEYISKNVCLYKMRNSYELSTAAAANFTRQQMATFLRSRDAYQVNLMIGGYDDLDGPALYHMDFLGTLIKVPFAGHGYGGQYFSTSVMDKYYKKNLTRDEAYEIIRKCIQQMSERFVINLARFQIKVIDKDGVHDVPEITVKK